MNWLFLFASFERVHLIQAIEVNIIDLLLDVSGTSIIALAGIPAGRLWSTHNNSFNKHQCSLDHTHSFTIPILVHKHSKSLKQIQIKPKQRKSDALLYEDLSPMPVPTKKH